MGESGPRNGGVRCELTESALIAHMAMSFNERGVWCIPRVREFLMGTRCRTSPLRALNSQPDLLELIVRMSRDGFTLLPCESVPPDVLRVEVTPYTAVLQNTGGWAPGTGNTAPTTKNIVTVMGTRPLPCTGVAQFDIVLHKRGDTLLGIASERDGTAPGADGWLWNHTTCTGFVTWSGELIQQGEPQGSNSPKSVVNGSVVRMRVQCSQIQSLKVEVPLCQYDVSWSCIGNPARQGVLATARHIAPVDQLVFPVLTLSGGGKLEVDPSQWLS